MSRFLFEFTTEDGFVATGEIQTITVADKEGNISIFDVSEIKGVSFSNQEIG